MSMTIDEARRIAGGDAGGHAAVTFDLAAVVCGEHGEAALRQACEAKAGIQRLAGEFRAVLERWLTAEQMAEIDRRNRGLPDGTCASHDFCDANMAMLEAFQTTCGRDPLDEGPMSDADIDLWNAAWTLAMRGRHDHVVA